MLVELRNYTAANDSRDALIDHFEQAVVPFIERIGSETVGSFRDVEDAASYWVFRSYTDLKQRDSVVKELAGSNEWRAIETKTKEYAPSSPKIVVATPTPASRFQGRCGGSGGAPASVMEIRFYQTHRGVRESYVKHFEANVLPSFERLGAWIAGQLINLDDPDSFIWLWPFADKAAQAADQNSIYESDMWRSSLRAPTIAFLADYSSVVTVSPTARSDFQG